MSINQNVLKNNALDVDLHATVGRVGAIVKAIWRSTEFELSSPPKSTLADSAVNVSHSAIYENHPLASLFGKYNDEPLWDGFEEAIMRLREEDNAPIE